MIVLASCQAIPVDVGKLVGYNPEIAKNASEEELIATFPRGKGKHFQRSLRKEK
jgi:hypothetical protein